MSEEKTLNELLAEQGYLKSHMENLQKQRAILPRNEKKQSHELLTKIMQAQSELRKLKPQIVHLRNTEGRQEKHHAWKSAVLELFGPEGLKQCYEHMKGRK